VNIPYPHHVLTETVSIPYSLLCHLRHDSGGTTVQWIEFITVTGQQVSVNSGHLIKVARGPGETTYVTHSWVYGEPVDIHVHETYDQVMDRLLSIKE
jgi:hypothetical protein